MTYADFERYIDNLEHFDRLVLFEVVKKRANLTARPVEPESDEKPEGTFRDRLIQAASQMSTEHLTAWIGAAQKKGDPRLLEKLLDILEGGEQDDGELVINIVPYEVEDKSVERILNETDDESFQRYVEIVKSRIMREHDQALIRAHRAMKGETDAKQDAEATQLHGGVQEQPLEDEQAVPA